MPNFDYSWKLYIREQCSIFGYDKSIDESLYVSVKDCYRSTTWGIIKLFCILKSRCEERKCFSPQQKLYKFPNQCVIKVLRQKYRNFSNIHEESGGVGTVIYLRRLPETVRNSKGDRTSSYRVSQIQVVAFDVTSCISIIKIVSRAPDQLPFVVVMFNPCDCVQFTGLRVSHTDSPSVSAIFRSHSYQFSYRTSANSICRFPAIRRRHVAITPSLHHTQTLIHTSTTFSNPYITHH